MTGAAEILVFILSGFLALFLLLAIILIVMLIRVTRQIQSVTKAAKDTANNVSNIMAAAGKVATPAILTKLVTEQLAKLFGKKRHSK